MTTEPQTFEPGDLVEFDTTDEWHPDRQMRARGVLLERYSYAPVGMSAWDIGRSENDLAWWRRRESELTLIQKAMAKS